MATATDVEVRHPSQQARLKDLAIVEEAMAFLPPWVEVEKIHFHPENGPTIRISTDSFCRMFAGKEVEVEAVPDGTDLIWETFHVAQLEAEYAETGWPRKKNVRLPKVREA